MAQRVGVRELHQQTSSVLKRVLGGEVVEVTARGRPIARIVPLQSTPLAQMVAEGRATEAQGDLLELMNELGLPDGSEPGKMLPSEALAELRADER